MENKGSHNPTISMMVFFIIFSLITSVGVIYCIFKIQKIDAAEWQERSQKREAEKRTIEAKRGNIISSDGKILATTSPVCDLYIDLASYKKHLSKIESAARRDSLEQVLLTSLSSVCQILDRLDTIHTDGHYKKIILEEYKKSKPSGCKLIKRKIPYIDWIAIKSFAPWNRIVLNTIVVKNEKGETVNNSTIRKQRAHIYGNLGGNVIGFQNSRESQTYSGLEGYYDSILRGQDGSCIVRRLTRGVWIPTNHKHFYDILDSNAIILKPTIEGQDIVSTIDTRYQDIADNALRQSLIRNSAESGCAILMEKETGYILACVNLSFDSTQNTYTESPDRNIACSFKYEPGSTFKTVIMTAMLEDTSINLDTAKRVTIGRRNFHGIKMSDGINATTDTVSIPTVIAKSSNVGMCELGWEYYQNRRNTLKEQVESIFPYDLMDYDIKTLKVRSHINNLNRSNSDFLHFCFGYSTAITAMQLATFYNAIANKGTMMKPLFCKQKGDTPIEPVILREKICSEKTADIITDMLVGVVEKGTGRKAVKSDLYKIAGKTGTAYSSYDPTKAGVQNASFAGYFPADNPRYTCVVVVRGTRANGAPAAGTVFKKIADCVMAIDTIAAQSAFTKYPENNSALPYAQRGKQSGIMRASQILGIPFHSSDSAAEWCSYEPAENRHGQYNKIPKQNGRIPNCKGMSAKDAILLLEQHGCKADISGYGKVKSQKPIAGTATKGDTIVHLLLSH